MPAQRFKELAQIASTASARSQISPFLRFAKIKSEPKILAAAKHNLREIPCTPNISPKRSCFNEVLIGPATATAVKAQFKAMLAATAITKLRKDAVLLIEVIVSLPVGVDDQDRQYFRAALGWLENRFGQGNLLSAALHNDDSAQHMHVLIIPLVNGAMNGSDLLGGPHHIRALQRHFRQAMQPALEALGVQATAVAAGMSEAEMAQEVQAHLKSSRDPVFGSVAWQPIRDCIERHPRLFYEYLGCSPLPPSSSTRRAIRPRKRMPTMAEIFTRRVGKLLGSQVEKYRDSEEYKRAHAVYVKPCQADIKEDAPQKCQDPAATKEVSFCLAAPPFKLRTLCSVGFAWRQERGAPSPLAYAVKTSLRINRWHQLNAFQKPCWCSDNTCFLSAAAISPPEYLRIFSTEPIAASLLWRWPASWPRAPPTDEFVALHIVIIGENRHESRSTAQALALLLPRLCNIFSCLPCKRIPRCWR